jgi:hypothetical protein
MSRRCEHTAKYLAPKRHVPRDYKDTKVGDCNMGAGPLARIVLARLREQEKLKRYFVVVDIDGCIYVIARGPRVREFVDLHTNLVVGMYDKTVHVDDLTSDLQDFLTEAA